MFWFKNDVDEDDEDVDDDEEEDDLRSKINIMF